jgi:hypothetical protein
MWNRANKRTRVLLSDSEIERNDEEYRLLAVTRKVEIEAHRYIDESDSIDENDEDVQNGNIQNLKQKRR